VKPAKAGETQTGKFMGQPFEDLTWEQVKEYISVPDKTRARSNRMLLGKNFGWFLRIYLSHLFWIKPAPFQEESWKLASEKLVLLEWPRFYGKSATFGVGFPLWVAYENPFNFDIKHNINGIMYISNALDLCMEMIQRQKIEILYNDLLNNDFNIEVPEKSSGFAWRSDEYDLLLKGKPIFNMRGRGKDSSLRGKHPPIIVMDDFEGDDEARNEDIRDETKHKFRATIYPMLGIDSPKRNSRLLIVGTPNHPECLLNELEHEDWLKISKYPILNKEGNPLWPEYESYENIMEKRRRMGNRAFMAECMLTPVASENPIFSDSMINEFTTDSDLYKNASQIGFYRAVALDPAISMKKTADYTSVITIEATREKDPKFFVRGNGARRGRWLVPQIVSILADVCEEVHPHEVIIETVQFQQAVKDEWDRYCDIHKIYHHTKTIKPNRDKVLRAHAVVPALSDGRVYFETSNQVVQALVHEMMIFPKKGKNVHDDLVDSFVYAMTECMYNAKRNINRFDSDKIIQVLPQNYKKVGNLINYGYK